MISSVTGLLSAAFITLTLILMMTHSWEAAAIMATISIIIGSTGIFLSRKR